MCLMNVNENVGDALTGTDGHMQRLIKTHLPEQRKIRSHL